MGLTQFMKLIEQSEKIRLILSDVDGVLTDGCIIFDNQGIESKNFHIHDGLGIRLWKNAGFEFGLLTARSSHIVKLRAAELGIDLVRQGFEDKLPVAQQVMQDFSLEPDQVCYIGDDLTDLQVMKSVGLAVAVADAVEDVRDAAHLVTNAKGGRGAVRELVEQLLKSQGRWEEIIRRYH
jgi:3-deoxy-D-manno-octulosonate 8-phosphate phosphatase (KDO 8-P phosphatase)